MAKYHYLLLFTIVYLCFVVVQSSVSLATSKLAQFESSPVALKKRPCPCTEAWMCENIMTKPKREIFVFSVNKKNWLHYDWNKITTVVAFNGVDDDLMCHAHSFGARIVTSATIPSNQLLNETARAEWVTNKVREVQENFLDGLNVDFEGEIDKNETDLQDALTVLMMNVSKGLKSMGQHLQVTADFAWSPEGIDQHWYNYAAITQFMDFVFIMAYSERSQVLTGPCIAWANSAYNVTKYGLQKYIDMGISPGKMVLGVPWNSMRYPCIHYDKQSRWCYLKHIPFRAASCSDNAGTAIDYGQLVKNIVPKSETGRLWDPEARTAYFMYRESGILYQVWYDDLEALEYKYDLADELRLLGVGMWNADELDYTDQGQVNDMWGALPGRKL